MDNSKNGLFYLHSDHLGSNSTMTGESGQIAQETRYYPYGGWRGGGGPAGDLTDIGFTGHRHNNFSGSNDLGLIGAGLLVCSTVAPCAVVAEAILGNGTATCSDGDCTNEVQTATSVLRHSVNWLSHQVNRINHIINPHAGGKYRPGHDWSQLINYSDDLAQDYQALQPYLNAVIQYGAQTTGQNGQTIYAATVNGIPIEVIGRIVDGVFTITDAYIIIP